MFLLRFPFKSGRSKFYEYLMYGLKLVHLPTWASAMSHRDVGQEEPTRSRLLPPEVILWGLSCIFYLLISGCVCLLQF